MESQSLLQMVKSAVPPVGVQVSYLGKKLDQGLSTWTAKLLVGDLVTEIKQSLARF